MSEHDHPTIPQTAAVGTCCAPEFHAQLAEQLRQGSLEAYAHLVSDYKAPVFQFFQRLLADSAVAEDSSEKVFLRAYRMRSLLRVGTDLSGWIFRIACDLLRHKDLPALLKQVLPAGPLVQQAVCALPIQQRIVLLLHRFAGLGSVQIGSALRLTESAARHLILESYYALQQQMTKHISDERLRGAAQ